MALAGFGTIFGAVNVLLQHPWDYRRPGVTKFRSGI
ncbi:hypothetical protein SUDANB135_07002 (plasmid) [Streptomyces sp. SudanB135_2055]